MLYVNPLADSQALGGANVQDDGARRKVALQEMEHLFMFTLLQEMRKSVPADSLFGGESQRAIYNEMLDDSLSAEMAKSGQFGIARQMEDQLRIADLQRALRPEGVKSVPAAADNRIGGEKIHG